jgi:hydrogenase maturation protein HypF
LGFRPYVYRLAQTLCVDGYVANAVSGVVVFAQGRFARELLKRLEQRPPPLARITSFDITRTKAKRCHGFHIKPSRQSSIVNRQSSIHVLPDLATCPDCRRELLDLHDRRCGYAFINCTQCGPRYTIIETLPYDRPRTTMSRFLMCDQCRREYTDPQDRRYHAQPIACPDCGPRLALLDSRIHAGASVPPIEAAAQALLKGRIVAIKSLGGFQLACDATNDHAVARLRKRKNRPAKPFALMCESSAVARRFCRVSAGARKVLLSPAAPIVLLPRSAAPSVGVAASVAPSNPLLGVMLCYTPLHAVLFRHLRRQADKPAVLVMTSANRKDDPIAASDTELAKELGQVPDLVLTHDRPIANRCDDSVVLVDNIKQDSPRSSRRATGRAESTVMPARLSLVRRARGYAPQPIPLSGMFHVKHPILAVGAEFKNAFALASGDRVFMSPHIGTVATAQGEKFWLDTLARYAKWTGIQPEVIACDLHPDYASTRLAERLSRELQLPMVRVQHQYAHILSVMAEHGLTGPALGLAFDGTGYGTDGAVWGCEFLLVQGDLNWARVGHLGYLRFAGASDEVANPTRVAREYVRQAKGSKGSGVLGFRGSGLNPQTLKPLNPTGLRTSSLGRLFDAVAAMTGVCRTASFDGQAPVALEAVADPDEHGHWFMSDLLDLSVSPALVRPEPLLLDVSRETSAGISPATVSAKFHNTIALAAIALADELCRRHHIATVCLSGGSFQNALLRGRVVAELRLLGHRVYWNQAVPLNDGGVALGQVAAAAARRRSER